VASVVSLSAGEDQPVEAGGDVFVLFRTELSDKHGLHGGDLYSVIVTQPYWAVCAALVILTGLREDDPVEIAWTRMTAAGTRVLNDPWRIAYRGAPGGGLRVSHGGQFGLDGTARLRLRVHNPNDYPIVIDAGTQAKITLLAY
jgi:hypothetical protein